MVVEVDGEMNHASPEQIEYDQARDRFMNRFGLQVLRISAREVIGKPDSVVAKIQYYALEQVLDEDHQKQWLYAKNLGKDDIFYHGINHQTCTILGVN